MKTWEYKVAIYGLFVSAAQLTVWLNDLGLEGWELVSEVHFGAGNGTRYTFKRPKG